MCIYRTVRIVPLLVCLSALVSACSGSGGGSSTLEGINTAAWNSYQDATLQLRYPTEWILDETQSGVVALFLDPETNELGGRDNCVYFDEAQPNSTLIEQVDLATSFIFAETPEPQVEFLEVNNWPVARITGVDTTGALTVRTQLAYRNDTIAVGLSCYGFTDEAELVEAVFDTIILSN